MHKLLVSLNELLAGPRGRQTMFLELLPQIAIRQQVINNFGHQLPFVSRTAKGKQKRLYLINTPMKIKVFTIT